MIFQWIGMLEYIPCYSAPAEHWGFLPATRLASRIILVEQKIKKQTGPALCVLCGPHCGADFQCVHLVQYVRQCLLMFVPRKYIAYCTHNGLLLTYATALTQLASPTGRTGLDNKSN